MLSSQSLTSESLINTYQERPLKINSQNLSFKGFSVSNAVKKFGEEFGEAAAKNLHDKIFNAASVKNSGLSFINKDEIVIKEKNLGQRFIDVLKYPIVEMPLDIANAALKGLKKIGLKDSKFINDILGKPILKNRRDFVKNTSDVAAIQHYFEIINGGGKAFEKAHARFNPLVSNYNSTVERTLTRIVTGAIPAFFLANDAYNLSIYMNNNKELAKKEKKRRFNQEVARIGITAAATYGVLSLFAKSSNASGQTTLLLMSALTFASEIIGRVMAGTPVLPLNEKGAKRYAAKQGKLQKDEVQNVNKDKKADDKDIKFSAKSEPKEIAAPPEKGKLTIKNILKILGALAVAGFGIEKISNVKAVKNVLNDINKKYISLYTKDAKISKEEFKKLTEKLRENGFDKIANRYKEIVDKGKLESKTDANILNLGKVKDKTRYILIHQVLTFPVRFAWDTLRMPYKDIVKPLYGMVAKGFKKVTGKGGEVATKAAKNTQKDNKNDQEMLRNSLEFLKKIDKRQDYAEKVNKSILGSLDNVTKSNYSNADLGAVVKTVMSVITSGFLIADNYNMVMIDSKGKDKDLATQKAKERTIQRAVRILYGAFLVKLLNGAFAGPYNSSLLGAQTVNAAYAVATETLERSSVGLPLAESTREQIIDKEQNHLKAEGFKGAYFRFMAKLTGKKPMSERESK